MNTFTILGKPVLKTQRPVNRYIHCGAYLIMMVFFDSSGCDFYFEYMGQFLIQFVATIDEIIYIQIKIKLILELFTDKSHLLISFVFEKLFLIFFSHIDGDSEPMHPLFDEVYFQFHIFKRHFRTTIMINNYAFFKLCLLINQ